ncbi:MAG: futalosine hydrolase [Actinobacteria bacterium RBG_16_64_13]|nr:MAG: futalosine hydrolase [Actinobacteria bacterium RBG_16_64_13]
MELGGCEALREVLSDRQVILLAATAAEAEPLLAALLSPQTHVVATKTVYLGELGLREPGSPAAAPTGSAGSRAVPVALAISGCDKANAAHILTCLLQAMAPSTPRLVLQVGIAGAFLCPGPRLGAGIGDVVVATREAYSDTGSSSPEGWYSAADLGLPIARVRGAELAGAFPLDEALVRAAATAIEATTWPGARPAVLVGPFVTASRATGRRDEAEALALRWGALAESMEGAAAAHVCALYGAPFLEVRGVSNLVTDRDRESWQVERAIAVAGRAALAVVAALDRLLLDGPRLDRG